MLDAGNVPYRTEGRIASQPPTTRLVRPPGWLAVVAAAG
jgi:hypothetical protein